MRLLIALNARFPTEKAYGIQVETMARGAVAAGFEVGITYPRRTAIEPKPIQGITYFPRGLKLIGLPGWTFHITRWFGLLGLSAVAKKFRPDFVLANDPLQAAFFPKPWKLIWDLHDIPNPKKSQNRILIQMILKRSQGILSTNVTKLEVLKRLGFKLPPSCVLPNPVGFDPAPFLAQEQTEARKELGVTPVELPVVYAGQMYPWKGVETLIAAVPFLPEHVHVHLIGGIGKDLDRCEEFAASMEVDIRTRMTFHGLKQPEHIPLWLRAAEVIVIPNSGKERISREDTNPMKLYEALAVNAKIVMSDLPALREAAGDTPGVWFVVPDSPQLLAETILRTINAPDPERRKTWFSAEERAQQFKKFLETQVR